MGIFDWLFGKKNVKDVTMDDIFGFGSKTDNRTYLSSSELYKEYSLKKEKEESYWDNIKVVEEWYSEGKLKSETRWLDDTIIYKMEQYENGQVKSEIEWKKNKIVYEKYYDKNGKLVREINNNNVKLVSQKCWDEDGNEIECEE